MAKLKTEFNGEEIIKKSVKKHEIKLLLHIIGKMSKEGIEISAGHLTLADEEVKNYSIPIYTWRYKRRINIETLPNLCI